MGFVYFGKGASQEKITIGAATNLAQRHEQHRRSDPVFSYHLLMQEHRHFECERFLHAFFAPQQYRGAPSWFSISDEEIFAGTEAWEKQKKDFEGVEAAVEQLKTTVSNGRFIKPTQDMREACVRLHEIRQQLVKLKSEDSTDGNRIRVMVQDNEGIEGLISWKSQTRRRFDGTKFQLAHPDLYEMYCKMQTTRALRFLNEYAVSPVTYGKYFNRR